MSTQDELTHAKAMHAAAVAEGLTVARLLWERRIRLIVEITGEDAGPLFAKLPRYSDFTACG